MSHDSYFDLCLLFFILFLETSYTTTKSDHENHEFLWNWRILHNIDLFYNMVSSGKYLLNDAGKSENLVEIFLFPGRLHALGITRLVTKM